MADLKDRDLVRLHWPAELRAGLDALFAIDDAMADVVLRATQPALAAIKLAWWRERLVELDAGVLPAEPRLTAVSRELLTRGISGKALSELEDGWAAALEQAPDRERVADRGHILFRLAAKLLGVEFTNDLAEAGRLFASADAARRNLLPMHRNPAAPFGPIRREARPLTAFAALADRDRRRGGPPFEAEATPFRALRLLRHRLSGR